MAKTVNLLWMGHHIELDPKGRIMFPEGTIVPQP